MTRFPVLMYHAAASLPGRWRGLGVAGELLRTQLATLSRRGWVLTGLTEALALAEKGNARVAALTFDDAYADFRSIVVPILEDTGARATLYVPTGHIGGRARWLGRHAEALPGLLDWCDLEAVVQTGVVEIGSHSHTHPHLDTLAERELGPEVVGSRTILEQRLGIQVNSFCYPHGYHSATVRRAVRDAGYANACEVGRRLRSDRHRWAISRLAVGPWHTPARLLDELVSGGPRLMPAVKRGLQPTWRQVRRARSGASLVRVS